MPSLLVSSPQSEGIMKSKSKKLKDSDSMEVEKKKSKKQQKIASDDEEMQTAVETSWKKEKKEKKEKKDKKKRKKESDDERSETSSDSELVALNKKPKIEDPNAIVNFRISDVLRERLKSKGIESLFPIQAMTFDLILDGQDLVGRARTGQVKHFSRIVNQAINIIFNCNRVDRKHYKLAKLKWKFH
jgi:ATP-dependent RNA helicase DDX21